MTTTTVDISEHVVSICETLGLDWDRVSQIRITVDEITVDSFPRAGDHPVHAISQTLTFRHKWSQKGEGHTVDPAV